MSTVAFPSGYNLERDSQFLFNTNAKTDFLSDGTAKIRVTGTKEYVTINCRMNNLFSAEKTTLTTFLKTNKANTITWTIDSVDYSGVFVGPYRVTMTGVLFNVSFTYYASEV